MDTLECGVPRTGLMSRGGTNFISRDKKGRSTYESCLWAIMLGSGILDYEDAFEFI